MGVNSGGEFIMQKVANYFRKADGLKPNFYSLTGLPDDIAIWKPFPIDGQSENSLQASLDDKIVILADAAMNSGRTIVEALNESARIARPKKTKVAVIYDGQDVRKYPVQPDFWAYRGKNGHENKQADLHISGKSKGIFMRDLN